jgi:hypothetical protein
MTERECRVLVRHGLGNSVNGNWVGVAGDKGWGAEGGEQWQD